MKVKNKILRRHEAYSVQGTEKIPEYMELTEEDLYVAKFVRNMEGMNDIIDEALKSVKSKAPRTRDQTAMLLNLVHTNKENFRKKDMAQRQHIWRYIAKTLNQMNGPVKSVDGWKKAYWSWRLQAGDDYEKELERWLKRAPAVPTHASRAYDEVLGTQSLSEESLENQEFDSLNPSSMQEERFFELIMENMALLRTGSNDEPFKKQIWTNIANKLNSLPGIVLTSDEWRKRGNWGRLNANHEKRKQLTSITSSKFVTETNNSDDVIPFGSDDLNKVEFEIINSEEMEHALQSSNMSTTAELFENEEPDDLTFVDHDNDDLEELPEDYNSDQEFLYITDEEEQQQQRKRKQQQQRRLTRDSTPVTDYDDEPPEYKPQAKRLKSSPPIVKSFKFKNRIVHAVEKLSTDVHEMKNVLLHTSNSLASIEELMERQSERQDETNALLKRNNQLLKILVEYKTGKRINPSH